MIDVGIAKSIRHLVARQRGRLSADERQTLEAASVAGMEFSAAAVAAALTTETVEIERHCEQLAERQHFLRRFGVEEWPDGTLAARYRFLHALYQELWHERVSPTQLQLYHRQIGERKERAYGDRAREIATALALHFEQGRDYRKAVQYLRYAGENAMRRSAHQETYNLLTRGLTLLKTLPDSPERGQHELRLLKCLGPTLVSLKGYGVAEVERTYTRAYEICQKDGKPQQLFSILFGLQVFYFTRGEIRKAREVAEEGWRLGQDVATPTALMAGHAFLVEPLLYQGEFTAAREHLEQAWERYEAQTHNLYTVQSWVDPGVWFLCNFAVILWMLGYADQAWQRLKEGIALAEGLGQPFSVVWALRAACWLHVDRREWQRARECAEEMIRLSSAQGLVWVQGTAVRGLALAEQGRVEEGVMQIQQDLAFFKTTGAELARLKHLPWLAAVYGRARRVENGLAVLAEALAMLNRTGMRINEAELYRLKGELTLLGGWGLGVGSPSPQVPSLKPQAPNGAEQEAETCFLKAIEIARRQQAKSWELRATVSLARLWQSQGKEKKAHKMLSAIYNWFTEGFDTKDLQEAKALLAELHQ